MSGIEYSFTVSRDSTNPEGRDQALRRIRMVLRCLSSGVSDRANCFLHGLTLGWVLGEVIGHADADEIRELLPSRPAGVIDDIPFGPEPVSPEVEALGEEYILDQKRTGWWFSLWMGIKNNLHFFRRDGRETPERVVFAWLGYLRGALESGDISQAEYDTLRAMLPAVDDDLTPLVAATP